MQTIKAPIHIIHDKDDKFALYKFSEKYSQILPNVERQTVSGTGHMRIVKHILTRQAISTFLKKINASNISARRNF